MTEPAADALAPSAEMIERLAREAIADLPPPWRDHALQVVLQVEDFASEALIREMEIEDPFELTGLYDGTPLTEKSVSDQALKPDMIFLFRRPILDEWAERGTVSIKELVTHIVVHELAHHFGWSDEDIAGVDRWWE